MKEYVFPVKIKKAKSVIGENNLLKKKTLQIGLYEPDNAVIENGYVILDFGKEMCGGARIFCFDSEKASLRLRFGESLSETCSETTKEEGDGLTATNDHALRDFNIEYLPRYSDMTFANTGFRFLRIDVKGKVELKSVVAVNNILKKKATYTYKGGDALIKKIFSVAKRTVDLCASSGLVWDGVKRDRLVWVGDMHPEMLAYTTIYGRLKEFEDSLDFSREQAPLPNWMNMWFPSYSMWWLIIVSDYAERTGAWDFAERQLDYIEGLIKQMDGCVKEDGELNYPSYFVDWPTCGKPHEKDGVRAINIAAAKKTSALLKRFGRDNSTAEKLLKKLNKIAVDGGDAKQVIGLKYFATGELSEKDKENLVKGGAKGMSTFMSYYILKAVASFDEQKAIDMMKEFYGAMLGKGATTFFEDFDMDWVENSCRIDRFPKKGENDIHGDFGKYCYLGFRHSLCHGWSAGIIALIKEYCK